VLTADDVRQMRELRTEGMTTGQLAIRYGISAKQVWRICNYEQWRWVQ
jgi:DNA invertase Pin-like site-specific DNA recombinase